MTKKGEVPVVVDIPDNLLEKGLAAMDKRVGLLLGQNTNQGEAIAGDSTGRGGAAEETVTRSGFLGKEPAAGAGEAAQQTEAPSEASPTVENAPSVVGGKLLKPRKAADNRSGRANKPLQPRNNATARKPTNANKGARKPRPPVASLPANEAITTSQTGSGVPHPAIDTPTIPVPESASNNTEPASGGPHWSGESLPSQLEITELSKKPDELASGQVWEKQLEELYGDDRNNIPPPLSGSLNLADVQAAITKAENENGSLFVPDGTEGKLPKPPGFEDRGVSEPPKPGVDHADVARHIPGEGKVLGMREAGMNGVAVSGIEVPRSDGEKIAALRTRLEKERNEYVQKEFENDGAWKTVKAFFRNLKREREDNSEVLAFRAWYEHSLIELANLELGAIRQSGLPEEKIKEKMAAYLHLRRFEEAELIDSIRRDCRTKEEKRGFVTRAKELWTQSDETYQKSTFKQKLGILASLGWGETKLVAEQVNRGARKVGEAVNKFNRTKAGRAVLVASLAGAGAVTFGAVAGGTATAATILGVLAAKRALAGAGVAVAVDKGGEWLGGKIRKSSSVKEAKRAVTEHGIDMLEEYLKKEIVFKTDDALQRRKFLGILRYLGAISLGTVIGGAWLEWFRSDGDPTSGSEVNMENLSSEKLDVAEYSGMKMGDKFGVSMPPESNLKEVIDRVQIPPPSDLPPASDVAETVPGESTAEIGQSANVAEGIPSTDATGQVGTAETPRPTPRESLVERGTVESASPTPESETPVEVASKEKELIDAYLSERVAGKGDSLWAHSDALGEQLGFDEKGQARLAALIEGAIREKIADNPDLLKAGGFLEGKFVASEGEHLWLGAGKPVNYGALLNHDELAKIVAEAKAQSGMTAPLGSTIAATESVTSGTPGATADAPTAPPESPVATTPDHSQRSGGDSRITFFDADASEDRGGLRGGIFPQPEELASQSTPTETEPSDNADEASTEPSERPPMSPDQGPSSLEGRGDIEKISEESTAPANEPETSPDEEVTKSGPAVVPESPKLTAEEAAAMVGQTPAPPSSGLETPSNNEGAIAVASGLGAVATGAELARRKLKERKVKKGVDSIHTAGKKEKMTARMKKYFTPRGDFINKYIRTLDRDTQKQLFKTYRDILEGWADDPIVRHGKGPLSPVGDLINQPVREVMGETPSEALKEMGWGEKQRERLEIFINWASRPERLGKAGRPGKTESIRAYILRITTYAHAAGE